MDNNSSLKLEDMFYKKEIIEGLVNWHKVKLVHLPNGLILTEEVRENDHGWDWHDEPPQEYLDWLEEQNGLDM